MLKFSAFSAAPPWPLPPAHALSRQIARLRLFTLAHRFSSTAPVKNACTALCGDRFFRLEQQNAAEHERTMDWQGIFLPTPRLPLLGVQKTSRDSLNRSLLLAWAGLNRFELKYSSAFNLNKNALRA